MTGDETPAGARVEPTGEAVLGPGRLGAVVHQVDPRRRFVSEACAVPRCTEGVAQRGVCGRHLSEAATHRRKGKSWRKAMALVGVPAEAAEILGAPLAGTAEPEDDEDEAPSEAREASDGEELRCETCGVAMTRGRGDRPRWCPEHRVEGRRAAAAARLKARVAPAPEVEVEPDEASDETPDEEEPTIADGLAAEYREEAEGDCECEPGEPAGEPAAEPAAEPEALPDLVKRLRRALPRHARDAFVVGYLLGRGGS